MTSDAVIFAEGSVYVANRRTGEVRLYVHKRYWDKLRELEGKRLALIIIHIK